ASVTSRPPIDTVPVVAASSPAMIRSSVDFPEPDGPTRTSISPSATSSAMSSSALTPPSNSLLTPASWMPSIANLLLLDRPTQHSLDEATVEEQVNDEDRQRDEQGGGGDPGDIGAEAAVEVGEAERRGAVSVGGVDHHQREQELVPGGHEEERD